MKNQFTLIILLLTGILFSCQNNSNFKGSETELDLRRIERTRNEIAESAKRMNSNCPIDESFGFIISSVSFMDSIWKYECQVDESILRVDSLVNHQEIVEDMAISWISGAIKNDSLLDEFTYARIYLQYDMVGSTSGKHIVTTISPEKLLKAYYSKEDPDEKRRKKIATSLAITNAGCPFQMDEVTIMQSCRFDGINIVYDYIISETQGIDFSDKSYRDMFADASREMIEEQFTSGTPAFKNEALEMFDMCIAVDANLIYNYRGSTSTKLVQIIFTPKDMVKLSNEIRR